jgi:hypothetical protein
MSLCSLREVGIDSELCCASLHSKSLKGVVVFLETPIFSRESFFMEYIWEDHTSISLFLSI